VALLDRYNIEDPADTNDPGVFTNSTIQGLYDQLVARGSQSLVDALQVGAEIEELDIIDLQQRATDTPDIALVYANLEKGSRNHLRAFTRQLEQQHNTYVPVHLSQEAYDAILSSPIERGRNGT
jgi:hypothetical protein